MYMEKPNILGMIIILLIPAISVPVGFCKEGFLLGLQVIGRWMDEVTMMKVARAIELIINS